MEGDYMVLVYGGEGVISLVEPALQCGHQGVAGFVGVVLGDRLMLIWLHVCLGTWVASERADREALCLFVECAPPDKVSHG
jgi:hypothetical protein